MVTMEWIASELAPPNSTNTMATLTAIIIAVAVITVFGVLTTQARERRNAQHWRAAASAERELSQAQAGIRKHAGVDQAYKPRTIGGGR